MTIKRVVTALSISACLSLTANSAYAGWPHISVPSPTISVSLPPAPKMPTVPPAISGGLNDAVNTGISGVNGAVNEIGDAFNRNFVKLCTGVIMGAAGVAVGMSCQAAAASIMGTCDAEVAPETGGGGAAVCSAVPGVLAAFGCGVTTDIVFRANLVDEFTETLCSKL